MNRKASTIKICKKSKRYVAMQKWLPCEIVSNHLGQEMKHHKSILYDDFMHLSVQDIYCQMWQNRKLFKTIYLHLTKENKNN